MILKKPFLFFVLSATRSPFAVESSSLRRQYQENNDKTALIPPPALHSLGRTKENTHPTITLGKSKEKRPLVSADNRDPHPPTAVLSALAGDGSNRIVGGTQSDVGEFPYYVDMGGCGGSLI